MKSVLRSFCSIIIVFFAAVVIMGCAKSLPAAHPSPTAAPAPSPEQQEAKKIIVAKVNDRDLTMDRLVRVMNDLPEIGGAQTETIEERKKRALDSLVLLELAYQRATALGLNADPVKVQIGVDVFKNRIGGDNEYADYLTRHGMTDADVQAEVERGITINNIYTKEVVDQVSIPEEDLKREYEKEKDRFLKPEKLTVIDVYLLKDEGAASRKKAKELLNKIKADPKRDPWNLVLDGTFFVKNEVIRREQEKDLFEAAKKLKPQEVSGVLRDSKGILHVVKLKEYSPERRYTYDEAKPAIMSKLNAPLVEKRTHEWEAELKKDAKIERLLDAPKQNEQKKP